MLAFALALHLALASTGSPSAAAVPAPADAAKPAPAVPDAPPAPATGREAPAPGPDVLAALPLPAAAAGNGALEALPPPAPAPRLAAITLAPRELDRGPFRPGELAGATVGAFAGDALVLGSGYLALQGFANGTIAPTANNFRHAIYALGVAALVVPPLTAVLMAKIAGGHGRGAFWKAMLLATAGNVASLAAGYYAAPRFWVVLPIQAVTLSLGASLGLHWGPSRAGAEDASAESAREPADPRPGITAALATPICRDG